MIRHDLTAAAIAARIALLNQPYAVFVRRDRVSFMPDDGPAVAQLRGNPESAACEVGVFGPDHSVAQIAAALEKAC